MIQNANSIVWEATATFFHDYKILRKLSDVLTSFILDYIIYHRQSKILWISFIMCSIIIQKCKLHLLVAILYSHYRIFILFKVDMSKLWKDKSQTTFASVHHLAHHLVIPYWIHTYRSKSKDRYHHLLCFGQK